MTQVFRIPVATQSAKQWYTSDDPELTPLLLYKNKAEQNTAKTKYNIFTIQHLMSLEAVGELLCISTHNFSVAIVTNMSHETRQQRVLLSFVISSV